MRKKYIIIIIIIIIIGLLFSINKLRQINELDKKDTNIINTNETFKNELLENFVDRLEKLSTNKNIEIKNISLIKHNNRTYLQLDINNIENSNYLVHYEGIDLNGIYVNIPKIEEQKMEIVSDILSIAILSSDKNITTKEAINIVAELFLNISDNQYVYNLKYKNSLVYTIEILENGGLLFYVE